MPNALAEKLVTIGKKIGYIGKDGTNDYHKYDYTSHAAVVRTIYPLLQEHGIAVTQANATVSHSNPELTNVIVEAGILLMDSDTGETAPFRAIGQGSDKGDKAVMKAKTAASKYIWQDVFGLAWGDDPEADAEVDKRAAKKASPKKKAAPKKRVTAGASLPMDLVKSLLQNAADANAARGVLTKLENSSKGWGKNDPAGLQAARVLCEQRIKELS